MGTALPLNGGAYNALLNTTSKQTASIAACLTILSYVATGVVSGTEACHYLANVWEGLDVYAATIVLIGRRARALQVQRLSASSCFARATPCYVDWDVRQRQDTSDAMWCGVQHFSRF